ncbi:PREDICTED: thymidylate synthase-like [Habropoda laboriosa]|uniref:thymidylate synthase-like n=1 Tax=Habropoda laboriosa TaxID=597456 RepID=UPI00083DAD66|nr:PREDICTED: thymidylate synthase-like [Habropoda laboriosa]
MRSYLDILKSIRQHGELIEGRNGFTISSFGERFRHDLRKGFPLLTVKQVPKRAPLAEMFAFLRGETNNQGFEDLGCKVWRPWALDHEVSTIVSEDRNVLIERAHNKGIIAEPTEEAFVAAEKIANGKVQEYNAARLAAAEKAVEKITTERSNLTQQIDSLPEGSEERKKLVEQLNSLDDACSDLQAISYEAVNKFMEENEAPPSFYKLLESKGVSTTRKKITNEKGDLGPIYGQQWRHWKTTKGIEIDQIKYVIDELTTDPHSRRIVLNGWNPEFIPPSFARSSLGVKEQIDFSIENGYQALPPCHLMTIFKTTGQGRVLNLHQIMRSCDVPIGLPFNIAGYAYLLKIMAKQLKMEAGEMIIDITDAHIYEKNKSEVSEMLSRDPMELCELTIPDGIDITDKSTLTNENIDRILENVQGYKSHPKIKMEVSV